MAQTSSDKKDRFSRIFPDRVEKLVKQFQLISNCSASSNYEYDRETVAKVWTHILDAMMNSAEDYGLDIAFTINGKDLLEVAQTGSIASLFEATLPEGETQEALF